VRRSEIKNRANFGSHSKKWNRSAEAGDENRRGEGKSGFGNEQFSNAKKDSPAEAIEGVVKRIDLLGCEFVEIPIRTEPREQRARVQLVR